MAKKAKAKAEVETKETKSDTPKRVLLVDDDPEIVDALRYALEAKGFEIMIARDGNQGLAMAERELSKPNPECRPSVVANATSIK